jgi:dCMP deaminase
MKYEVFLPLNGLILGEAEAVREADAIRHLAKTNSDFVQSAVAFNWLYQKVFVVRARPKWDYRFLRLAKEVSTWSKDPSTKVGCVIVGPERDVISVGYNGFARGVDDGKERYADRDNKIASVIHGEQNALLFADRWRLKGATAYTMPWQPCAACASKLIQAGIKRVVSIEADEAVLTRWGKSIKIAENDFLAAGVELVIYPKELVCEEKHISGSD